MLRVVRKLGKSQVFVQGYVQKAKFGGHGGHVKEYDWRDDPKVNPDIYEDIRDKGWKHEEYTFPYVGHDDWFLPITGSAEYIHDDVHYNIRPENKKFDVDYSGMRVSHSKYSV